jgi:signal transduction histidine kinase
MAVSQAGRNVNRRWTTPGSVFVVLATWAALGPATVLAGPEVFKLDVPGSDPVSEPRPIDAEELERRASARREDVRAAIAALVLKLAHDVRNPLFGISATVDALESRLTGDERYREYIDVLRQSATRVNDILHKLVESARPRPLDVAAVSIGDVVAEACRRIEPMARAGRVTLETDTASDLPHARIDAARVVQVLTSILENAIEHAPAESRVRLVSQRVSARGRAWVECRILDSGPGLLTDDLARAFQPLFSRSADRTGIGLSIAKQIVERHGGEIEIDNRDEGGAMVTLRLPAVEA